MLRRLFSIKVRDNIISDISHVLLARKRFFATRITRYPNSDSTFRLQRLLSCSDVSRNSGPVGALNSR